MQVLNLITLVLLTIIVIFLIYAELMLLRVRGAPLIPTPVEELSEVFKYSPIDSNSVVYDLGCGDARVLLALYKLCPEAKYIGVEKFNVPYLLAKFNVWKRGAGDSIIIKRKDILSCEFSNATHIFVFLSEPFMKKLYPVFKQKLYMGTYVVSHLFPFADLAPFKAIENNEKRFLGKHFYVYKF